MKKIILVNPKNRSLSNFDLNYVKYLTRKMVGMMNAALPTVAALVPREFTVKIVDENIEPVNFHEPCDIVGITGFVSQYARAKEIAARFSEQGALVVCGGSSVSLAPERWKGFSDVLMIGESERIWPQFCKDFLEGKHKSRYQETERFDLSISPIPNIHAYPRHVLKQYMAGVIQTSRGCPFNCEFCSVIKYNGRKMRYKPIDNIVKEVEQMKRFGFTNIFIADDNFSADKKKSKEILKMLREWNRKQHPPVNFVTQLSIDSARDEEFLVLAAEAGLTKVSIGIETPNVESLREAGKLHNVGGDLFGEIKKFHEHGIMVHANSIIGFDHDGPSIFDRQFEFYMKSGIPNIKIYPLQPRDGSALKERAISEGRYLDWETQISANSSHRELFEAFTIVPKRMDRESLHRGIISLTGRLFEWENVARRMKTFFDNYENSHVKKNIHILRKVADVKQLLWFIWRIVLFLLFKSTREEKKFIAKILLYVRNSSYPQKYRTAVSVFISTKNVREMLHRLEFES